MRPTLLRVSADARAREAAITHIFFSLWFSGGAMRPINEEEDTLWGLEEEVSTGRDGEKHFKPKKLGQFFCQHHGVPG